MFGCELIVPACVHEFSSWCVHELCNAANGTCVLIRFGFAGHDLCVSLVIHVC